MSPGFHALVLRTAVAALVPYCIASVATGKLVPRSDAERAGLVRAWYSQAAVDPSQSSVVGAQIAGDSLYTLTSAGVLQAFDTQSGAIRWSTRLGRPGMLSFGPHVRGDVLAFVNGSTLFVIDAKTGRELSSHRLPGAVGAAPAVAQDMVFVPLASGRIEGFPLGDSRIDWGYMSGGRIFQAPTIVGDRVVWTTDRGQLFAAYANAGGVTYKFQGAGTLVGPAAWLEMPAEAAADGPNTPNAESTPPRARLFIASSEGYLYALDAERGVVAWRSSVGMTISRPATAVAGRVYVGSAEPMLHAFDAETGDEVWAVEGVDEFVAASATRVYGVGPLGELFVIDAASGEVLSRWPASEHLTPVANHETDRMFFVSESGLVQAFHEVGADKPFRHGAAASAPEGAATTEPAGEPDPPQAEEPATEPAEDDPFAADARAADEPEAEDPAATDDPFAAPETPADGETAPADDVPADDDPFADF